jgi:uroporphyrinogen decarboxylase
MSSRTPAPTARQRVLAALQRRPLDEAHPPFTWGFGPSGGGRAQLTRDFAALGLSWDRLRIAAEDVAWLYPRCVSGRVAEGQPDYMAIWGIRTRSVDYGLGRYDDEIAFCPLAGVETAAGLDAHDWPRADEFDYGQLLRDRAERDPEGVRAVRLSAGNPFEIYSWMTGLEEAMMNLVENPDFVRDALGRITAFFKERFTREAAAVGGAVDLVFIGDDLGGQHGPLLAEASYLDVIQPFHRDLCRHIRATVPAAVIEYHSDGSVYRMLPHLIDAGVQVLEAVQVECADMEPARLKRDFGDRLMFQGAISVQQVLPRLPPAEVRRVCRDLVDTLGRGGGYLAAPSHAIQAGTPAVNILAMLEEVLGPERHAAVLACARA